MQKLYLGGKIFLNDYSELKKDKDLNFRECPTKESPMNGENLEPDKVFVVQFDENNYPDVLRSILYSIKYSYPYPVFDSYAKAMEYGMKNEGKKRDPEHLIIRYPSNLDKIKKDTEDVLKNYLCVTHREVKCNIKEYDENLY